MIQHQITAPLIVVSNRLPFVLHRREDGQLSRKARYVLGTPQIWHDLKLVASDVCISRFNDLNSHTSSKI